MGQPVVHFEITGADRGVVRGGYGSPFGREFAEASQLGSYGFVDAAA
jgi:hypothetical protein